MKANSPLNRDDKLEALNQNDKLEAYPTLSQSPAWKPGNPPMIESRPEHRTLNGLPLTLRHEVNSSDIEHVREIVESTGFFHPAEIDVAVELVDERLRRGDASGYFFVLVEHNGKPIAYSCYGPIACTASSFDIFWIAVHRDQQKHGIGAWLMTLTEDLIRGRGGRRVYVETSGRDDYLSTRRFYDRCDYHKVAELPDFYADGDSKVIYLKEL